MSVPFVLKLLLSSCVFLTLVVPNVNSNGTPFFSIAGRLFSGGLLHNDDHVAFKAKPEDTSNYEKYFTQKLDHFKKNSATFQQRYFVNAQYSTNNSIYFLLVEGDNVASASRVSNLDYPHMISAKDAGATVYNLEHRFYGSSQPFKTMSAKNMTFLTSQQALEDISNFVRTQNRLSGDKNPKWVLFGGGYGGSLVVWHRQKYPGLSTGVISSGATVIASGDYYAFQLNVENSYKEADKNCFNGINNAINRLKQLVQYEEGRDILNKKLNLQPPFSSKSLPKYRDLQNFFHNIAVLLQIPVQNNKVNAGVFATEVGIDNICKIFNNTATANLDKVAQMAKYVITQLNGTYTGVSNSYHDTVAYLKNETFNVDQSRAATRAWFWQNCNEFGYFTSTDNSGLVFGSTIPNNFFINLCVDVFGHHHGIMNVLKVVKNTQDSYGREKKFNQTNAVITRGSVDPWKSLGVESVSDKTAIAYLVNGGAHCAEFQPPKSDDSYGVKMARNLIKTRITRWLSARTKKTMKKVAEFKERTQENYSERREIVNWDAEIEWNITLPEESALLSAPPGKDRPILADFIGQTSANSHLKRQKEENAFAAKSAGVKPFYFLGYVLQDLDHFNSSNNLAKKWRQIFVSNNAHKKKDGPIFLMVGGETRLSWYDVYPFWSMSQWARQFGASVYALEHRYYGYSTPFTNLTVQNLTYLTSEQALGDIAVFIKAINKEHNKTETEQKWILFGGAYAGSLVAWFRLKYPELSTGAVASSAPVQAKTDFFEYLFVVQNSTKNFGGKTCAKNVHEFFAWGQSSLMSVKGREKMSNFWCMCEPWDDAYIDEKDSELALASMVWIMSEYVQYDDEGHDFVEYICDVFNEVDIDVGAGKSRRKSVPKISSEGYTELEENKFIEVARRLLQKFNSHNKVHSYYDGDDTDSTETDKTPTSTCWSCQDFSYKTFIYNLKYYNVDYKPYLWMTCNEFGWFQSTNIGYNLFESSVPVNFYIDMCADVFGKDLFNRATIDAKVKATNDFYGGNENYNGTNVFFVNGSEDPWHPLSAYHFHNKNNNVNVTSILIEGTSMCEDMYRGNHYDTPELKAARKKIRAQLKSWLQ